MSGHADLRLVALHSDTIRALGEGRLAWSAGQPELHAVRWPEDDKRVLRYRIEALDDDPASSPYLLSAILDGNGRFVGRIGCHAGPDRSGEVEIGYRVIAAERGRGIAGWAVDTFTVVLAGLEVASIVASIRPDNAHSLAIVEHRCYVAVGSHLDDEDGLEVVYRRSLTKPAETSAEGC